jgi:Na+-translocating ferredoxin:NAD+ oxidoreductase subunit E
VVIATFVTITDMVLRAYFEALHTELGVFIPLIVVNCIILGRAEPLPAKTASFHAAVDGLGMGLGFTLSLTLLGFVRELLGAGTLFRLQYHGVRPFSPSSFLPSRRGPLSPWGSSWPW